MTRRSCLWLALALSLAATTACGEAGEATYIRFQVDGGEVHEVAPAWIIEVPTPDGLRLQIGAEGRIGVPDAVFHWRTSATDLEALQGRTVRLDPRSRDQDASARFVATEGEDILLSGMDRGSVEITIEAVTPETVSGRFAGRGLARIQDASDAPLPAAGISGTFLVRRDSDGG